MGVDGTYGKTPAKATGGRPKIRKTISDKISTSQQKNRIYGTYFVETTGHNTNNAKPFLNG